MGCEKDGDLGVVKWGRDATDGDKAGSSLHALSPVETSLRRGVEIQG